MSSAFVKPAKIIQSHLFKPSLGKKWSRCSQKAPSYFKTWLWYLQKRLNKLLLPFQLRQEQKHWPRPNNTSLDNGCFQFALWAKIVPFSGNISYYRIVGAFFFALLTFTASPTWTKDITQPQNVSEMLLNASNTDIISNCYETNWASNSLGLFKWLIL